MSSNTTSYASSLTWGCYDLCFQMHSISLGFSGLSLSQMQSIETRYAGFIKPQSDASDAPLLSCRAYRMPEAPQIPFANLTRDGQYAPLQNRRADAIDVTGLDFRASIPLQETCSNGSLGVVKEAELANPSVVENVLRVFTAYKAVELGGVILHSAGIVIDKQAYIFVGRSNAGKTTLTRKAHAFGAKVLSDDINMVLPDTNKGGYQAHAVPFTGEFGSTLEHAGGSESFALAAIVLLEQSETLQVSKVQPSEAVAKLLVGCPFVNMDVQQAPFLFDAVTALTAKIPVVRLQSARDEPAENIINAIKNRVSDV